MYDFNLEDSISFLVGLKEPLDALLTMNGHNLTFRRNLGGLLIQYRMLLDTWRCGLCESALNNRKDYQKEVCRICFLYGNYIKKNNKKENEIQ
jgi:hypothetical protein